MRGNALAAYRRRAARALADATLRGNLRRATDTALAKRAARLAEIPDYDDWREKVAAIRRAGWEDRAALVARASAHLAAAGARVHHAADAAAARRIVAEIAADAGARLVVKGKSMLTEEIELTPHLEALGLEVLETDLGEFIVQLRGEMPSHITAPALHLNRRQVSRLFADRLGAAETEDPEELTLAARRHLRDKFLAADVGISGGNFVVAETGTLVTLENEGNIGLSTTLPRVHVALTGIEKCLPRLADLDPVLRLLPPNGTGQQAVSYVSLLNGPAPPGCGPEALHVVFVDNGRSALAASGQREILACLRCGACLNVCPVFRNAGGHSYGAVYPGPMGILLAPYLLGDATAGLNPGNSLADVCSLCEACGEVCPAAIPLPDLILGARAEKERRAPASRRLAWRLFGRLAASPRLFRAAGAMMRMSLRVLPAFLLARLTPSWSRARALPAPPPRSFRAELRRRHPGRLS